MNRMTTATAANEEGLQRRLGLASATALVAGEAIAVGIFLTPAGMAKSLGSPFWLLLVWLVVGAMTLSGALCYGELAGRFPRTGGTYVYLEEAYGRRIAFYTGGCACSSWTPDYRPLWPRELRAMPPIFSIGLHS